MEATYSPVYWPRHRIDLTLGPQHYDLATRALVVGVLNRTTDSFYDHGAYFSLDRFFERADELVRQGADVLDVGGVKAGPGPEVSAAEELERVVPVIASLHDRFDVPLSVDTWRASVAADSFKAGAVLGNDISGFGDPDYLPAASSAGASVVATHIRLAPRVRDPEPEYDDVSATVCEFLESRVQAAFRAGIPPERVMVDAGLDLGKTPAQSLELLRATDRLSALGHPVLLSASNKTFLGQVLDLDIDHRREASLAAVAIGIAKGARVVRVHDVDGTRRVRDALAAILQAA